VNKSISRLTEHSDRLLEVLKQRPGEWVSRSDIARILEKRKLSAYDIAMLEILEHQGVIEIKHRDNRTPIGFEYVYRTLE
jgi:hypothetical protein